MSGKLKNYADWPWPAADSRWLEEWAEPRKHDVSVFATAAKKAMAAHPGVPINLRDLIDRVEVAFGKPDTRVESGGAGVSMMDILGGMYCEDEGDDG